MDKLKMQAKPMDVVLKKVMEICPSAVQNGKVDFDRLREKLSDVVDDSIKESYDFTWVGKRKSIVEANKPINKTLRPVVSESKNWETTENLYIEGDNLEVLKLLQESYLNKVKMIYIDPPYNTGKDFVYKDNFKQSKEDEAEGLGLFDEEGNKMFRNTETNGRFHSDWCSMMYPRLKLARDFLTDDGVIFISIDDNEVANLRKICDEVFGEDNFIGDVIWNSTKSVTNTALISVSHTYNLIYAKNKDYYVENRDEFRLKEDGEGFENPDNDPRGPWKADPFQVGGWRPNQQYDITNPKTGKVYKPNPSCSWKNDYNKFQELINDNRIVFGVDGNAGPQRKRFLSEATERGKVTKTLWDDVETTTNGTQLLKKLLGGTYFDNPKPISLIKRMLELSTKNNGIILDFFSGSATTAHAVMQLNAEDGGKRKFIMVQLPEATEEDSEAAKAGYANICQIGKERIRRAGEKIKADAGLMAKDLDIGFRVLKLADSNMQDVYYTPAETSKKTLLDSVDNIKNDRKPLDLLFGVMVDWGVSLSLPLSEYKVGNNTVYVVGDNDLVACFDTNITPETITKMAIFNPTRAVFRDSCFAKDDAKINMMEIFKATCGWDEKQAKDSVKVI